MDAVIIWCLAEAGQGLWQLRNLRCRWMQGLVPRLSHTCTACRGGAIHRGTTQCSHHLMASRGRCRIPMKAVLQADAGVHAGRPGCTQMALGN